MRGRKRKCAIHTNTKFAAIAEAQAAASEPWNPDRRKRGPEHVVLLTPSWEVEPQALQPSKWAVNSLE